MVVSGEGRAYAPEHTASFTTPISRRALARARARAMLTRASRFLDPAAAGVRAS